MSDEDLSRGLYAKYEVTRLNDPDGKHEGCHYFVLDPQHDPIALKALKFYGKQAREAGYFSLADDLQQWTHGITEHQGRVTKKGPLTFDDALAELQSSQTTCGHPECQARNKGYQDAIETLLKVSRAHQSSEVTPW